MVRLSGSPLDEVTLRTKDFSLVERLDIPRFSSFPDVLVWGERVFKHLPQEQKRKEQDGILDEETYIEVFAFWVPPETTR